MKLERELKCDHCGKLLDEEEQKHVASGTRLLRTFGIKGSYTILCAACKRRAGKP